MLNKFKYHNQFIVWSNSNKKRQHCAIFNSLSFYQKSIENKINLLSKIFDTSASCVRLAIKSIALWAWAYVTYCRAESPIMAVTAECVMQFIQTAIFLNAMPTTWTFLWLKINNNKRFSNLATTFQTDTYNFSVMFSKWANQPSSYNI